MYLQHSGLIMAVNLHVLFYFNNRTSNNVWHDKQFHCYCVTLHEELQKIFCSETNLNNLKHCLTKT